ncbi:Ribonuclease P/MRP protein subunit POP5 [Spathaspora sp. JA1]|nr:Ribonuclease P/MRP protein subunit POP5 [Spathaspora sp. JA1]
MVRVKQRYILFDILYPPTSVRDDNDDFCSSESNALLSLHQSSPSEINQKSLIQAIRKSLQLHYGDFGGGSAGMLMSVKYFSNKTSTGIVRCGRGSFELIVGALALITKIEGYDVLIRCTHVSGTIKKCEEYSVKKSKELMYLMSQSGKKNDLSNWMSDVKTIDLQIDEVSDEEANDS